MHLYLMQHGLALSKDENPERPLSERGRSETLRVAEAAARAGVTVDEIRHSTKLRARQTAETVAEHLRPPGGVMEVEGLAPMDDPVPVAARLAGESRKILLVSHMPFLQRLADLLLSPRGGQGVVCITNSALVGLERTPTGYRVSALVPPTFLR
jgi:phosphohistidine phosphatase